MLTRQSIENFTKLLYKSKFLVEIYSIYLVNCKLFKWKLLRTEVARYVYLSKANDLNNQTPFNAYTLPAADITKKTTTKLKLHHLEELFKHHSNTQHKHLVMISSCLAHTVLCQSLKPSHIPLYCAKARLSEGLLKLFFWHRLLFHTSSLSSLCIWPFAKWQLSQTNCIPG